MRRLHLLGAVLVLAATTGCGTMANVQSSTHPLIGATGLRPSAPFGGVAWDCERIRKARGEGFDAFPLIDFPFSLVGDVLTLPVVGYQMWERSREKNPPPAAVAPLPASASPARGEAKSVADE